MREGSTESEASGVSPEFLAALPLSIQQEVLAQERAERVCLIISCHRYFSLRILLSSGLGRPWMHLMLHLSMFATSNLQQSYLKLSNFPSVIS